MSNLHKKGEVLMLIERLKSNFKLNEPIFIDEIFEVMHDYSRQRIYQLITLAINDNSLMRYDNGIYYLPIITEFGYSIPAINDVVNKKYINNNEDVYGIYGKYVIELNFLISTQVPNTIEVITNNESRKVREIEIRGHKVVLRKSRVQITKENQNVYTLMELFNNINMDQYKEDKNIKKRIIKFIKDNNITRKNILSFAKYFPAKVIKNIAMSEIIYEIA